MGAYSLDLADVLNLAEWIAGAVETDGIPPRQVRSQIFGGGAAVGRWVDLFGRRCHNTFVHPDSVRTSIDMPRNLHRRLHEAAARQGCSARQLILRSIERAVEEAEPARPRRRLRLDPPLIPPAGRHIDLTNEQIHDLIDFP